MTTTARPAAGFPGGATIVFGGSGGIGQHVAQAFGAAGSDVAIVYRSKRDVAERVAGQIRAAGRRASVHQCDVTVPAQVEDAVAAAQAEHGRLHTVAWAAGPVVEQLYISEIKQELWHKSIDIEVHGFFNAVQATLPRLRAGGGGSYVHLGSAGHVHFPQKDALSVVPKAANEALLKGLAKEEGRNNIRANSILVGVIEAGMFLELLKRGVFDQKWIDKVQDSLALKRWGQPEEIGAAAVFFATNGYVTGQQLNVSGGYGI
jgi:3-oxoacyl-[acyl-carrier protein] reductase